MVGVATPTIDVVLALVKQRGEIAGLYTRPKHQDSAEQPAVAAQ
jgi:2-dehydropantoate 2-reductase